LYPLTIGLVLEIKERCDAQRLGVISDELGKIMSLPVFATLPNDSPSLYEAYSQDSLLPANTRLGKELNHMAMKVGGVQGR
jgi:hypothetical protein